MEVVGQISGFESYDQVIATLGALQREAEHPKSEAHAEAVAAQIAIFSEEASRMESLIAANIEKENAARYGAILGRRLPDAVSGAASTGKRKRRK